MTSSPKFVSSQKSDRSVMGVVPSRWEPEDITPVMANWADARLGARRQSNPGRAALSRILPWVRIISLGTLIRVVYQPSNPTFSNRVIRPIPSLACLFEQERQSQTSATGNLNRGDTLSSTAGTVPQKPSLGAFLRFRLLLSQVPITDQRCRSS